MKLINTTGMQAGYTLGLRPDGGESIVVAVKGTFTIPNDGKEPALAAEQAPLIEADVFTGEPGLSAPVYETDYAPRKPRCDVLLNGSAYAPGGKPATRVTVALRVGPIHKSFDVVGDRVWKAGVLLGGPGEPEPFGVMPISYDNAFGGVDRTSDDPSKHHWYPTNHAGVGYYESRDAGAIEGKPLPNTEETGHRVRDPRGKYRPMAFGPIGRAWQPRPRYAGTYDQKWLDNAFPFLPADFQDEYYQSAPGDQQMPHPRGGEEVVLVNLTPEGHTSFRLPKLTLPVTFSLKNGEQRATELTVDTVCIEPDAGRFLVTARASLRLRRNIFEVSQAVVGEMSRGWRRARAAGKAYYRSLAEFVSKKGEAE